MSVQHTNASRLRMARIRDARLVEQRAAMTDAQIADAIDTGSGCRPGDDVELSSGRVLPWAEFVVAYRAGDVLNAYRRIIERGGALR